jgi:hypothetical protein
MKAETLIRIRDLDGSKGRLEEALRLLQAEEGFEYNPADDLLMTAIESIEEAIGKYDDEIGRLE